jgi:hypothetical protein
VRQTSYGRSSGLGSRELLASIERDREARQRAAWVVWLALALFVLSIAFGIQYMILLCLDHAKYAVQSLH